MGNKTAQNKIEYRGLAHPMIGNALTALTGIVCLFLCMIFPLVGPAAVHGSGSPGAGPAPHLAKNRAAFSAVLILALILAIGAIVSKLERRRVDASPLPFYSIAMLVFLVAVCAAFAMGLLSL